MSGLAGHWRGPTKDQVYGAIQAADDARSTVLHDLRMHCIGPILEALRAEVLAYADERRINGTLEFHDLLILARDVLASQPGVRAQLSERYNRILVDEFQDTDPVQIEIATLLASSGAVCAWDLADVAPGRLFFVGDPKQSIYRFRGADIDLYRRAAARFGERSPQLTVNFRSTPSILQWVNDVFGTVFRLDSEQVDYVDLAPSPRPAGREVAVRFFGHAHKDTDRWKPTARRVRLDEAPDIAAAIHAIKNDRWKVRDASGRLRPARYNDITILLPARTTLPGIEQALEEADIPFRVESQSLLYATQEVRDLTAVLGAIDDPPTRWRLWRPSARLRSRAATGCSSASPTPAGVGTIVGRCPRASMSTIPSSRRSRACAASTISAGS